MIKEGFSPKVIDYAIKETILYYQAAIDQMVDKTGGIDKSGTKYTTTLNYTNVHGTNITPSSDFVEVSRGDNTKFTEDLNAISTSGLYLMEDTTGSNDYEIHLDHSKVYGKLYEIILSVISS